MRRRLLLVFPILVAVGLMAAFWGLTVAMAQTPTPTPSPTITLTPTATPTLLPAWPTNTPAWTSTPTPTPTRTPTPGPGTATATPWPSPVATAITGTNQYVWGCVAYGAGAPVCTWGDYFEISAYAASGSNTAVTDRRNLVIVMPPDTTSVYMGCSAMGNYEFTSPCTTCDDTYIRFNGGEGATLLSASPGSWAEFTQGGETGEGSVNQTHFVTITKSSNSYETWAAFPADGTFSNKENIYPYIRIEASARGRTDPPGSGVSAVRAACEIYSITKEDGSSYVPPGATPVGDFPTPTPTGWYTWTDRPWVDVPYVTVPDQQSDFYFGPGTTTCAPTLPGWSYTWVDMPIFGTTSFGWNPQQICLQSYPIYSEMLNIRIDTMVGQFVSVLFALFMFNLWRRQS